MNFGAILFSFNGRIRRTHYWLGVIGLVVVGWVLSFVLSMVILGGAAATLDPNHPSAAGLLAVLSGVVLVNGIVGLILLWPSLALAVKRLHDRDKSGWWIVLMWLACFTVIGALWPLIELGFLDGTMGPNRFGPSPKGITGPPPEMATAPPPVA